MSAPNGDASVPPTSAPREFPDEYGTPATIIRAFYAALGAGRGDIAALLVVPEKTGAGAFAADRMSRFYGDLREPLALVGLSRTSLTDYRVHYRYAATRRRCDGHAIVTTVIRARRFYIQGIRALDGC